LGHEFGKLTREQRLRAIAEGVIGIVMHFHQEAIGSGGNGSTGHGRNEVAPTDAM
jgi:hypothetical protein